MRLLLIAFVACGRPQQVPTSAAPTPHAPAPQTAVPRSGLANDAAKARDPAEDAADPDASPDAPPDPQALPCELAVGDPALYPPVVAAGAPERDWTIAVRREVIEHECDHGWSGPLRACLAVTRDAPAVDACLRGNLAEAERAELAAALADLDALAAKLAAARKRPASIGCKQVVAAHYGDARWRGKLDGYDAAARTKLIADSRSRMTRACTAGPWDARLRACVVVGGGETCFASHGMALSWGYPAAGVVTSLGVPACDAYRDAVQRIATCGELEPDVRDALQRSFEQMQARMASLPAAEREKLAPGCNAGKQTVEQLARDSGC